MSSITRRVARVGVVALTLTLVPVAAAGAQGGPFSRLSVSSTGEQGDNGSFSAATSADGRFTAFVSNASNLVPDDANGRCDTFVRDTGTGTTTRVSLTAAGAESGDGFQCGAPAISGDGRHVAFVSDASDLVPGDTNGRLDVFVRDREAGTTGRVSVSSAGAEADGDSFESAMSADGRFVAFSSGATNLVDGEYVADPGVYVHELATGATEWVSCREPTGITAGPSYQPSLSGDGRYVAFALAGRPRGGRHQPHRRRVRARSRARHATRVSVASDGDQGDLGSAGSEDPAISADGRYVAFTSDARDLVPGVDNTTVQVYVRDRTAGATSLVSVNNAGEEGAGDHSLAPTITRGRALRRLPLGCQQPLSGSRVRHDRHRLRDTVAGVTRPITVGRGSGDYSIFPSLSADGSTVAFASLAAFLVDGDTNGTIDVFRGRSPAPTRPRRRCSSRVRSAFRRRHPPVRRSNTPSPRATRPTRIPPSPASLRRESRSRSATRPSPAPRPTRATTRPPGRSPSTCRAQANRSTISSACSSSSTSRAGCGRAWTRCSCSPRRWSPGKTSEAPALT